MATSSDLAAVARDAADPAGHRALAIATNNLTWALLEDDPIDVSDVLHTAHAAAWHWAVVGEPVNHARAEWLVGHVYAVLGWGQPAQHHAARSLAVCEEHGLGDFDLAYAYEGVARAAAAAGDAATAADFKDKALAVEIADDEDRELFTRDVEAGPWFEPR